MAFRSIPNDGEHIHTRQLVLAAASSIRTGRAVLLQLAASEAVVLALTLVSLAVAQGHHGGSGLGEYVLVRRVATAAQLVLLAGLGVGVPRFVARDPARAWIYILVGSTVLLLNGFLFLAFSLFFPVVVGALFLGGLNSLALPVGVVTLSQLMHASAYSALRGLMNFGAANTLQVVSVGVVPLVCLLVFADVPTALVVWGVVVLMFAMTANATILVRSRDTRQIRDIGSAIPALLAFGIPRVITDGGVGFVNALPVVLVAHADVAVAGSFGAAQSVLTAGAALLGVSGVAWLPRAALMLSRNQGRELAIRVHDVGRASLRATVFANAALLLVPLTVYQLWLGETAGAMARVALLASIWALPGIVLYSILRSPLDAVSVRPWSGVAIAAGALTSAVLAITVEQLPISKLVIGPIVFGSAWCAAGAVSLYLTQRLLPAARPRSMRAWLVPGMLLIGAALVVDSPFPAAMAMAAGLFVLSVASWLKTLPDI